MGFNSVFKGLTMACLGPTILSHITPEMVRFSKKKKKNIIDHKIVFYFLYNFCLKHVSF